MSIRLFFYENLHYSKIMSNKITNDRSYGLIPFYIRDGQILFLLIKHRSGHWAFPKGHPIDNEKMLETIKRELLEETDIQNVEIITNKMFIEKYIFKNNDETTNKTVSYYTGITSDLKVRITRPEEITDYIWLNYEQACKKITYESSVHILKEANEFLQNYFKK